MIAVDTNIVVRLLVADDAEQAERARLLFRDNDIYIPDTVILEVAWVLRAAYDLDTPAIVAGLRGLFGLPNVHLRDAIMVALALDWSEAGLDFADAVHLAQSTHCTQLATFDRRFADRAERAGVVPTVARL